MKQIIWLSFGLLLLTACEEEPVLPATSDTGLTVGERGWQDKIAVCHYAGGSAHIINISANAWPAHAGHGDVLLTDADGDGYVTGINDCVPGGDCDDNDDSVNPGAEEICGDNIDNDCDGQVDEDCTSYPTVFLNGQTWLAKNLDIDIPGFSWCYDNDPANCATYGRLYTWQAAQDACAQLGPGWRLPSFLEWYSLLGAYGGNSGDNSALIEGGSAGLDLLYGGWLINDSSLALNSFVLLNEAGGYWTSTYAYYIRFDTGSTEIDYSQNHPYYGYSCRCVKD